MKMKKTHLWILLFWAAVIGIKVWAGFHGQTTLADSISEIIGFACLLLGTVSLAFFTELSKRRFLNVSAARVVGELADHNYFALLLQGILLLVLGVLAIFLKWWITVILGAPLLLAIVALFFKGWPSFRLNTDAVARSVRKTQIEFDS